MRHRRGITLQDGAEVASGIAKSATGRLIRLDVIPAIKERRDMILRLIDPVGLHIHREAIAGHVICPVPGYHTRMTVEVVNVAIDKVMPSLRVPNFRDVAIFR